MARGESNFCFPAEIAHGLMESALRQDADYWFLPHLVTLPSYEADVHACVCPLTQGQPYYLRTAFDLDDSRLLRPVLEFTRGFDQGAEAMVAMAERLGATRARGARRVRRRRRTAGGLLPGGPPDRPAGDRGRRGGRAPR